MSKELKKCPFCGGQAKLIDDDGLPYDVNCIECGAGSPAFMTPELAIEAWNNRYKE